MALDPSDGWGYYCELSISGPISDYQMKLIIKRGSSGTNDPAKGIIYDENKCYYSDMRDVRVGTTNDPSTATQLKQWTEKVEDGIERVMWIKTNGSSTLYLFAGNSSASEVSSGSDVWDYFDDFENYNVGDTPSGWTTDNSLFVLTVSDDYSWNGTKSLKLDNTDTGAAHYAYHSCPRSEPLRYFLKTKKLSYKNTYFMTTYDDTKTYQVTRSGYYWEENDWAYWSNGTKHTVSAEYNYDWYSMEIYILDSTYYHKAVQDSSSENITPDFVSHYNDYTIAHFGFAVGRDITVYADVICIGKYASSEPQWSNFGSWTSLGPQANVAEYSVDLLTSIKQSDYSSADIALSIPQVVEITKDAILSSVISFSEFLDFLSSKKLDTKYGIKLSLSLSEAINLLDDINLLKEFLSNISFSSKLKLLSYIASNADISILETLQNYFDVNIGIFIQTEKTFKSDVLSSISLITNLTKDAILSSIIDQSEFLDFVLSKTYDYGISNQLSTAMFKVLQILDDINVLKEFIHSLSYSSKLKLLSYISSHIDTSIYNILTECFDLDTLILLQNKAAFTSDIASVTSKIVSLTKEAVLLSVIEQSEFYDFLSSKTYDAKISGRISTIIRGFLDVLNDISLFKEFLKSLSISSQLKLLLYISFNTNLSTYDILREYFDVDVITLIQNEIPLKSDVYITFEELFKEYLDLLSSEEVLQTYYLNLSTFKTSYIHFLTSLLLSKTEQKELEYAITVSDILKLQEIVDLLSKRINRFRSIYDITLLNIGEISSIQDIYLSLIQSDIFKLFILVKSTNELEILHNILLSTSQETAQKITSLIEKIKKFSTNFSILLSSIDNLFTFLYNTFTSISKSQEMKYDLKVISPSISGFNFDAFVKSAAYLVQVDLSAILLNTLRSDIDFITEIKHELLSSLRLFIMIQLLSELKIQSDISLEKQLTSSDRLLLSLALQLLSTFGETTLLSLRKTAREKIDILVQAFKLLYQCKFNTTLIKLLEDKFNIQIEISKLNIYELVLSTDIFNIFRMASTFSTDLYKYKSSSLNMDIKIPLKIAMFSYLIEYLATKRYSNCLNYDTIIGGAPTPVKTLLLKRATPAYVFKRPTSSTFSVRLPKDGSWIFEF